MSWQRAGNGDLGWAMVFGSGAAVGVAPMQPMVLGSGFKGACAHQQGPAAPMDQEDRN